jgi:hypothetical protein
MTAIATAPDDRPPLGAFLKPQEVADGAPFVILGVEFADGHYGEEIVYAVGIDGVGRRRFSLSATPRREAQTAQIRKLLRDAEAVGAYALTKSEWTDEKTGEAKSAWQVTKVDGRPDATLADYTEPPTDLPERIASDVQRIAADTDVPF